MKRTFCDNCGKEITESTKINTTTLDRSVLEVRFVHKVYWNTKVLQGEAVVDICKYCLIDSVNLTDDRAQPDQQTPLGFS